MILNRQRRVRVPVAELKRFLASVQKRLRVPRQGITIAFVTDREIKRWNHTFRGKNRPTDVLSFPADESTEQKRRSPRKRICGANAPARPAHSYLGDIAIAPAVARSNARRFGRTFMVEMRILILHGILHLMGYDHETDEGQMERREARLRRELGLA